VADESVIKGFLVSLGFKVDETALKNFTGGIEKATIGVTALAAAIEATAAAVVLGVTRMASNLESLYFASMNIGTSVSHIKAMQTAVANFGGSAEGALSAMEGIARFIRNLPPGVGDAQINQWLQRVGKRMTGDKMEDLASIGQLFKYNTEHGQSYLNASLSGHWGIDEGTMLAIQKPGFIENLRHEQAVTPNFDKTAADANKFMMQMRDLRLELMAFGLQIQEVLEKRLGISIRSITQYLKDNGPLLSRRIAEILKTVIDLGEKIGRALGWLFDKFMALDDATNGWSTKLGLLAIALKFLGGAEILSALGALGLGLSGALAPLLTVIAAGGFLGWLLDKIPGVRNVGSMIGTSLADERNKVPDSIRSLEDAGWTHAQAVGAVTNLFEESALNPNAKNPNSSAFGIAQWLTPGQEEFRLKWPGNPLHLPMQGSTRQQQLDFLNWQLRWGSEQHSGDILRATRNAGAAAEMFDTHFERNGLGQNEAIRRGNLAQKFDQTININISGAPPKTAKEIVSEVKRHLTNVDAQTQRDLNNPVQ
jgi:Phage tail lysozyme